MLRKKSKAKSVRGTVLTRREHEVRYFLKIRKSGDLTGPAVNL